MNEYAKFLGGKKVAAAPRGLTDLPPLESHLFDFQKQCVEFGLRCGSFGLFLSTGLGKTACELSWSAHAAEASNGRALILTPLAVARQIETEGKRWGYDIRVIRSQDDVRDGINVCNYDRIDKLDADSFGAVALDESSAIKHFTGKTTRQLIDLFARHRWKMSASATPAPNDHTELGSQSEFLGIMSMNDMLVRWFINDSADTGTWKLKGHARQHFWDWMASWSRMAEHPRELGDDVAGYDLPPMKVFRHLADSSDIKGEGLFVALDVSATGIHNVKRQTSEARARQAAEIIGDSKEAWLIWVDTDYEQSAVEAILGDKCLSVRGSLSIDEKERRIASWLNGDKLYMLSKPTIMGYGLNLQFCRNQVFVGRSFSYETWHQAIRRSWRFGQKDEVRIHIVVAEGEDSIGRVIDRKSDDHAAMKREMVAAMMRSIGSGATVKNPYLPKHNGVLPKWLSV